MIEREDGLITERPQILFMVEPVVVIVVASILAGILLAWIGGHYALKMYRIRLSGSHEYEELVRTNLENQERMVKAIERLVRAHQGEEVE